MSRSVRGIELTAAGRAFLDLVRLAQVDGAVEAACADGRQFDGTAP
jgi:hypothetical protein